ncbi:RING/U-box superfamily protein [Striga hermonthica]|uniref:RING/U-box superfamily protein n=1 Tax=Striga hermonthica TaxID=68872 RepID=A0A9N7NGG8_STRHE|nr:RING/U-box superfamily protein [Striga hermonthica]
MDEEERIKRTRRTMLDQLEEERTFPRVLETIESESDEAVGATTSDESDEELECSSDHEELLYGGVQFGVELSEDDEYDDFNFYQDMEEDEVDPDELSYEELLALGEMVGVENTGLPEAEITKHLHNPLTCHSTSNLLIDRCVICQVEYEKGEEELAGLQCEHLYHKDCIVKWLQIKKEKDRRTSFAISLRLALLQSNPTHGDTTLYSIQVSRRFGWRKVTPLDCRLLLPLKNGCGRLHWLRGGLKKQGLNHCFVWGVVHRQVHIGSMRRTGMPCCFLVALMYCSRVSWVPLLPC